jgi:hypothetical protein
MKKVFAIILAFVVTPVTAQESLFAVETPSAPVQLAPLSGMDPKTETFITAWFEFENAWKGYNRSALISMLSGEDGSAGTPADQQRQMDFLIGKNEASPFYQSRMFASISSRQYPSAIHFYGWAVPENYSAAERAALEDRKGGEAIGCTCTGPTCIDTPAPKTSADTQNKNAAGYACARMIMAPDGAIRFEVDMPEVFGKS